MNQPETFDAACAALSESELRALDRLLGAVIPGVGLLAKADPEPDVSISIAGGVAWAFITVSVGEDAAEVQHQGDTA